MLGRSVWLMACASLVSAHMQLTFPLPLESSLDSRNTNPDYSMTAPLATDGSNFPCKGYLDRPDAHVTAAFSAGQLANFTLTGSATHGGGSCQVSLSYDGGKTFKVINTILGGCPLTNSYNFQFPAGLPAGKSVIFSWSWFNKVGNREMYQNCALVDIAGTGSSSFLSTLPDMQVANVGNGCTTIEGTEVIPKNPGSLVQYGGSYAAGASAVSGLNGAGLTGSCGTINAAAPAASPVTSTESIPVPTAATTSLAAARAGFKAAGTTSVSSTIKSTAATAATVSTTVTSSQSCNSGSIVCTGTGYTWSLCASGALVAMGAVAPGTVCKNGQMIADSAVPGNVAKTSTTSIFTSTTTSTTSKSAALPTNCLNKRDTRESCQIFSVKCVTPYAYRLCEGDDWSDARSLSTDQVCFGNEISHIDRLQSDSQVILHKQTICTGTGITCSEDGMSYYVCDTEDELAVPKGTRCVESRSGGGFMSWHGI